MFRFHVAREATLAELNELAMKVIAAEDQAHRAREEADRLRSNWRLWINVPENHKKYYAQFPIED